MSIPDSAELPGTTIAPSVRWAHCDDVVYTLDLDTGEVVAFERAALLIWTRIAAGVAPKTILDDLGATYDAPADRLAADYDAFIRSCLDRGLMVRQPAAPPDPRTAPARRTPLLPPFLGACFSRLACQWSLWRHGFAGAYKIARSHAATRTNERFPDLDRLLAVFAKTHAIIPHRRKRDDCLLRSISLFRFLRTRGVNATHVIGLSPSPFALHAWVELNQRPLLEEHGSLDSFLRMAVLG